MKFRSNLQIDGIHLFAERWKKRSVLKRKKRKRQKKKERESVQDEENENLSKTDVA